MKQNATLPGLYPGISALDLLDEVARRYKVERDLKNAEFAFLVENGLYNKFHEYLHGECANKGETLEDRIRIADNYTEL